MSKLQGRFGANSADVIRAQSVRFYIVRSALLTEIRKGYDSWTSNPLLRCRIDLIELLRVDILQ